MRHVATMCLQLVSAAAMVASACAGVVAPMSSEECNLLTSDVIALGTIQSSVFRGNVYQVVMPVDECVKGACSDTLRFAGWPPMIGGGTKYAAGERVVMVLVYRGVGATRWLMAHSSNDKITVGADDTVGVSGTSLDDYLSYVRELVEPRRPERLYEQADFVVVGRVSGIADMSSGEDAGLPVGLHTFRAGLRVSEVFKGEWADSLAYVRPPVLRKTANCYDYVLLEDGETVLLFLRHSDGGEFEVVGSHDGKHRVGDPTTERILEWLRRPPN